MKAFLASTLAAACSLGMAPGTPVVAVNATPDRSALPMRGGEAILQVEVRGRAEPAARRRTPLNLVVVLDRSGSMGGEKIEHARQAAALALDQVGEGDTFSLVTYDDEAEVVIAAGPVTDKAGLERRIHAIEARGSTALHAGVVAGAEQLRKHLAKDRINRIILLSDGQANVGPSSPAELAKLGSQLSGEGISVSTIGLGDGYNEDLMTELAESSEANYYYVKDAEKLPEVFGTELGTVKATVARDLRLIIRLPEGIEGTGILGNDEIRFRGRTLTIPLSALSSGQTRRFLVGVKLPPGETSDVTLADVQLAYLDTAGQAQSAEVTVRADRTADAAASAASLDPKVAGEVAVVRNRLAKEQAVALADAGKASEAADLLRSQVTINAALPAAVQSVLLRKETEVLAQRAAELERQQVFSPATRKQMQFENYQDKTQKR